MACVNVTNITVLDNPSRFSNPFQFEVSFECLAPLDDDIEWKLIYVGSAESDDHDQVLDEVCVGPMQVGGYKIVFQADAPDPRRIPPHDLIGVTVILLSCYYKEREFIRIGYYVSSEVSAARPFFSPPFFFLPALAHSCPLPSRSFLHDSADDFFLFNLFRFSAAAAGCCLLARLPRASQYDSPELNDMPPEQPAYDRLVRNILADKPRVTRYQIDWSN